MKRFWIILTAALLLLAAIGCSSSAVANSYPDGEQTSATAGEPAPAGTTNTEAEPEPETAPDPEPDAVEWPDSLLDRWVISVVKGNGYSFSADEVDMGGGVYEFTADGKVVLTMDGQSAAIEYTVSGNTVTMINGEMSVTGEYDPGTDSIAFTESGETVVFVRESNASASEPAASATEEPRKTEEDPNMKNPIVTITMKDGGVMKLELYPDVAPNTVKNFISLANKGFYDGLIFHRIIAGFMIQGGGFNESGMQVETDYSIKGEFASNGFKNDLKHTRGVISMARTMVPDSAGAQFFIMHADAPHLDGDYAAFGMLLEGFDVLDRIATVQTGYNDVPLVFPVIDTIRVDTFGVDYGEPEKIR